MKLPDTINLMTREPWGFYARSQLARQLFKQPISENLKGCVSLPTPYAPEYGTWTTDSLEQRALQQSIGMFGYEPERIKPQMVNVEYNGQPIIVDIDAEGTIGIHNGLHRLLYAMLHGIGYLPAIVKHRAPEWVTSVKVMYDVTGGEYLYQDIPHPDFSGWARTQAETGRSQMLLTAMERMRIRSFVDIGGCYGSMAVALAPFMDWVKVVEQSELGVKWATWSACYTGNRNIQVIRSNAFDYVPPESTRCITVMSVLHHLLHESGRAATSALLRSWGAEGRVLITENPFLDEDILNGRREAAAWLLDECENMKKAGWEYDCLLGNDVGHKESRPMKVWRWRG